MSNDAERVAVRVTRLALPLLALHPRPALLDAVVRAAVLIDLALAGGLVDAGDGVEVDTTPTGFDPADRLLAAVVAQPDKQIAWWLHHAPLTVHDIAEVIVAGKAWDRRGPRRRYRDLHPDRLVTDISDLAEACRTATCTPEQAATAALIEVLPTPRDRPDLGTHDLIPQCGSAAWIAADLIENLVRRRAILSAAASDAMAAQAATYLI